MQKITTEQQFQEMIERDQLTVMKYTTSWCPDCVRLNMFIDEIIAENPDKEWFEIDKDEFPELADKYQVMGIPSLLIYKNGEKIGHLHSANAKTPEEVREFLKAF